SPFHLIGRCLNGETRRTNRCVLPPPKEMQPAPLVSEPDGAIDRQEHHEVLWCGYRCGPDKTKSGSQETTRGGCYGGACDDDRQTEHVGTPIVHRDHADS